MRPAPLTFALPLALAVLAACSPLKLLPPIGVGDPMGISGMEIAASGPMRPTAVRSEVNRNENLANLTEDPRSKAPFGATPETITVAFSVDSARLDSACLAGQGLAGFDLTLESMSAVLSDDTDTVQASLPAPVTVNFVKREGRFAAEANANRITFYQVGRTLDILTKNGANTLEVQGAIASSRDELLGCRVNVVLGKADTSVKF